MGLLHERKETSDEIVVVWKYYPIYLWILFISLATFFFFSGAIRMVAIIIFVTDMIIGLVDSWKPLKEMKAAMKNGKVEVSGSKWSLSKPLTSKIKK